jgi:hypothetical protein
MNFEQEMRGALRREPAPPDFAAKVLAKVPARAIPIPLWRRPSVALAMAAGLALAALIPPAISEYHRRQEARALEARRELLLALSITRAKFMETRAKLQRAALRSTQGHIL